MIRFLLICACSVFAGGCVPFLHTEHFDPLYQTPMSMRDGGAENRPKLKTILLDAETKQEINEAQVIVILEGQSASLSHSYRREKLHVKTFVEKFSRLDRFTYTFQIFYAFPLFAVGTDYQGASMFVYERGYEPVVFKGKIVNPLVNSPPIFPNTVELISIRPEDSKGILIKLVAKEMNWIGSPELIGKVTKELDRRLE